MRIATAGWNVPTELAQQLSVSGSHLERHGQLLGAVEINTTFYRNHRDSTFERWADAVPDDFRFAVKLSRRLTHEGRLHQTGALLDEAMQGPALLGDKLGIWLVQLPPSLALDEAAARDFFMSMRARTDAPIALEARHKSWFTDEAAALTQELALVRVIADPPRGGADAALLELALHPADEIAYVRLHGSPKIYVSAYTKKYLADLAQLVQRRQADTWCVFDNTAEGSALINALDIARLLAARAVH